MSFYALGARRGGWVVHHALPGQCDRDRERLTAGGLDVGPLETAGEPRALQFDPAEAPDAAAERFEPLLADALERGHSALWLLSRFPIGPGAVDFANATAYDRAWDARFRGRPVVTLCPYVLAGEEAGARDRPPRRLARRGPRRGRARHARPLSWRAVELAYTIRRSTRARRVRVAVDAHDGVQVTLPARAREREAALAVAELRPWIERRLAEVRAARERLAVPGGHLPYSAPTSP